MRPLVLLLALAGSCGSPTRGTASPVPLVIVVRSADGPVPGARVELFAGPAEDDFSDMDALAFRPATSAPAAIRSATVGRDGRVGLDLPPGGRYWISVAAPGFVRETAATSVDGLAREIRLSLVRGAPFSGTIVDDAGPLSGTEVIAAPQCRVWPCDAACDRARTDAEGRFRFGALAPGDYGIWYRPEGGPPVSAGRVRIPLVSHLPVRAWRGGVVAGVVKDAGTGAPLGDAVVRMTGVLADAAAGPLWATPYDAVIVETRTDASGRFEAATHQPICRIQEVEVRAKGYGPSPVVLPSAALPSSRFADGQRMDLDLRLRKGVTIRGKVLGPDGPAAGIRVSSYGEESGRRSDTLSDANGAYRLEDLDPGPYSLSVPEVGRVADVAVAEGVDLVKDIRIDLRLAEVRGRVVDDEGRAARGARVWSGEGAGRAEARCDEQGRFALTLRGNAVVMAEAMSPDGPTGNGWSDGGDVKIVLLPVAKVRGQVRSRDGRTLAGARVAALRGEVGQDAFFPRFDSLREAVTDSHGWYELRTPWDGDLIVWAWSPFDGALGGGSPGHDPSGETLRFDVKAGDDRTLPGRAVLFGSGRGIEGLRVSVVTFYFDMPVETVCAVTGLDGRFSVPLPSVEKAAIRFEGHGYVPTTLGPGGARRDRPEMRPDLPVSGVVRREDGSPVIGAEVAMDGIEALASTTDTGGRFVILGVPDGDYELRVRPKEDGLAPLTTTVRAGARDVEIVLSRVSAAGGAARPPADGSD